MNFLINLIAIFIVANLQGYIWYVVLFDKQLSRLEKKLNQTTDRSVSSMIYSSISLFLGLGCFLTLFMMIDPDSVWLAILVGVISGFMIRIFVLNDIVFAKKDKGIKFKIWLVSFGNINLTLAVAGVISFYTLT